MNLTIIVSSTNITIMSCTYELVAKCLEEYYPDIYNEYRKLNISVENNNRLYRAIARYIMTQEDVTNEDEWVKDHYAKCTVCTIALEQLGYQNPASKKYIADRDGILCIDDNGNVSTMRELVKNLQC